MDISWYDSVRTYVRSVVHNPCGKDIARTIWPRMLKLSVYTLYHLRSPRLLCVRSLGSPWYDYVYFNSASSGIQ